MPYYHQVGDEITQLLPQASFVHFQVVECVLKVASEEEYLKVFTGHSREKLLFDDDRFRLTI